MKKYLLTFLGGLILGALICFGICKLTTKKPVDKTIEINQLEHQVDSLQNCIDSIKPQIDTIYQWRTKIKVIYEEKANDIWNQSVDADWKYYIDFLSSRFQSDSTTVETD